MKSACYQENSLGRNTKEPGRLILKIDFLPADKKLLYKSKNLIAKVHCNEVFECARLDSNQRPLESENYDKASLSDVEALILLVLHSCYKNKKKPVGGCHNRLFLVFYSAAAQ